MAQFTPGLQKDGTFKNHFGFLWFFPAVDPIHNPFFSTTCCFYPCTDIPVSLFCPCYLWPSLFDSHCPDFSWLCSCLCLLWAGLFWVFKQNNRALSRGPTSQLLCLFISGCICSKSILIAISHPSFPCLRRCLERDVSHSQIGGQGL